MKDIVKLISFIVVFVETVLSSIKDLKKIDKKRYISIKRNVNNELKKKISLINDYPFFGMEENTISHCFVSLFDIEVNVIISENKSIQYDKLIKDNEFMRFFTKLIIFEKTFYSNLSNEHKIFFNSCFSDVRAILMSYSLYKEKKVNMNKMLSFLSFFLKGSKITILNENVSAYKLKQIEMITTGIKSEKLVSSVNNSNYNPKSKDNLASSFDIVESMKNRIRIKYISGKNHKHIDGHKSPETHLRKGHFKRLRNGEIRWISETIVNGDKVA